MYSRLLPSWRGRTAAKFGVASGTVAGLVGLASAADYAAKCGDTRLDWVSTGPPTCSSLQFHDCTQVDNC
jgi:ammonia channel protein AmtB|eukprot:COSAG02_NODE_1349_length_13132_cov_8.583289_1_plen_70_part_00